MGAISFIYGDPTIPENLLERNGQLRLLSASDYDAFDRMGLRVWCHKFARYGLPTIELIEWLRNVIGERKSIEIGSGAGDLAFHLGIMATDSRLQEEAHMIAFYRECHQPVIKYPSFVQKYDALAAVDEFKPEIVIGSWITQWVDPNLPMPRGGGNMYGVKEDKIIEKGCVYVLIGNESVHGPKKIMQIPHLTFNKAAMPFLRSRATYPELDHVWIWDLGKKLSIPCLD